MNGAQKIIGNLTLFELAVLFVGGGAMAYWLFSSDLVKAAEAGAITVGIAAVADVIASGVSIGANSNNMLPGGSATVAGAQ